MAAKTAAMFVDSTSTAFNLAGSGAALPLRSDRVLNYVWLNRESLRNPPENSCEDPEHLCGIPLNYFDKAYANARRYPDTNVKIWVDQALLDDSSRFFVQSHAYLNAPENVTFHDLRDIPAYAAHPAYAVGSKVQIWNKVDLARFLVISHELENPARKQVFYSDFDIDDAALDNPKTQEKLQDAGMAFAEVHKGQAAMITHGIFNTIQHAYIVMTPARKEFLDTKMLPFMSDSAAKGCKVVMALFKSLYFEVCDMSNEGFYRNLPRIITDVQVPPIRARMPGDPVYEALKLCPSFGA